MDHHFGRAHLGEAPAWIRASFLMIKAAASAASMSGLTGCAVGGQVAQDALYLPGACGVIGGLPLPLATGTRNSPPQPPLSPGLDACGPRVHSRRTPTSRG